LLHTKKADDSEVKREFRYLSINLLGLDKEKEEQLIR
jgi:hypothetical protein